MPAKIVWFFDLDDTLHDASHAMFEAIDLRMTEYLQANLHVSRAEADRMRQEYWQRYGATLLGLVRHHHVNPQRFLRETHDFDISGFLRAERGLERMGRRLPGRKVLLTNAPLGYAERVLRGIGLHRHITTRYSVESMRVHGQYRPKPARSMLRAMLAREKLGGRSRGVRAVLVDDNMRNLKAAYAEGFATVLMARKRPSGLRRLPGGAYVMARVRSVQQLPALARRLTRGRSPGGRSERIGRKFLESMTWQTAQQAPQQAPGRVGSADSSAPSGAWSMRRGALRGI